MGLVREGVLGLALVAAVTVARAESLADAIALAYQSNPTLQGQRAILREADEGYAQARTAFGPTAQAQATAAWSQNRLGYASPSAANDGQVQLTVSQPLYQGGRATLGLAVAADSVRQAREALRATEGNVMLSVITAYADVVRDAGALEARLKNLQVLIDQVKEAKARVRAGELTLTDVAQAEAQLDSERALVSTAQGQLQISRAQYATVVGRNPGGLVQPPPLPNLPATIDQAFELGESESPDMRQVKYTEQASRDRVAQARATYRPTVSLGATLGYAGVLSPFDARNVQRAISGQATVTAPIFTNGLASSQTRAALDQNTADRIAIETARRTLVQNIANSWNQILVTYANVGFQDRQIHDATVAFTGMKLEYREGLRATLDVLIAEETLRDAEIARLAAAHDEYVAQASLLRVIGRLEAPALAPGLPIYDMAANLRSVEDRGQAPWTGLVEKIDALGAPGAGQRAIPAPPAARRPLVLARPSAAGPAGELITAVPTIPFPGTVSPAPPLQP